MHTLYPRVSTQWRGVSCSLVGVLPVFYFAAIKGSVHCVSLQWFNRNTLFVLLHHHAFSPFRVLQSRQMITFTLTSPGILYKLTKTLCYKNPVSLFSLAGVSRSTTMVVAYLMTVTSYSWEECLNAVKAVRSFVGPNYGFQQQLQEFQMKQVSEVQIVTEHNFLFQVSNIIIYGILKNKYQS